MLQVRFVLKPIFAVILLAPLLCLGEQEKHVALDGYTDEGQVSLLWLAHGWPEQAVGFKVKRRELDTGAWVGLSQKPICPEVSMDRNWSDQGLDADQIKVYRSKLQGFLEAGEFKQVSREEFLAQLQQVGMRIGDRLKFVENFDLAMVLGFGFIDSSVDADIDYEYGLFAAYADGSESSEPLDTYTTIRLQADDARVKVSLEAEQKGSDIELRWKSDRVLHEQLGFMSYNIYRRKTESDEWVRIRPPGISPREKGEEELSWIYLDRESDAFQSWYFAVAPVNKFQKEFSRSVVKYGPMEYRPAEIASLHVEENTWIRIDWKMDQEAEFLTKGFYLERSLADATNFVRLAAGLLPPGARSTGDREPPPFSELRYRIVTVDNEGKEYVSPPQAILFQDPRAPDRPQNFKLTLVQTNGSNYVRGEWIEPAGTNKVATYWTFSDARSNRKLSRDPVRNLGATNAYTWALGNEHGGRAYTFGIQPVSGEGIQGPLVLEAIHILPVMVPKLMDQAASLMDDGNILLSWKYPAIKDMIGFRILLNGEPVKMENEVPPDARSWVISDYPDTHEKNYTLEFDVQAVFPLCVSELWKSASLYMTRERPDRSIPAPDDFHANISGTYQGQRWAYLRMGNSYVDPTIEERVKGFIINVSNENGEFSPANAKHIELCTEYYFPIPQEYTEGAVYFRCAMEGEYPCGGLFKNSAQSLSKKGWKNEISDEKYEKMMDVNASHDK